MPLIYKKGLGWIGAYFTCLAFYYWAQCLYAMTKVDLAALVRLFLGDQTPAGNNRLEGWVFGRANRLLHHYGQTCAPGDQLIQEGDETNHAYFLYSGRVGLYKEIDGTNKKLGVLEAGHDLVVFQLILGQDHERWVADGHERAIGQKARRSLVPVIEELIQAPSEKDQERA